MEGEARRGLAIRLRPVQDDDEAFLLRVFASTREPERLAARWEDNEWDAFLRMQFAAQRRSYRLYHPNGDHSIILRDGEPVGQVWIDRSTTEIRLVDIAVLPEHRGCGIGTHLIRGLQAAAREAGVPLRHMVEIYNDRARRLYEHLGFVSIETLGLHTLMEWKAVRGMRRLSLDRSMARAPRRSGTFQSLWAWHL